MKIIKKNNENLVIIKKSKFIGIIKKIYTKDDAVEILDNIRKLHPLASHICYAYILPNAQKYDDDHEPLKTAGIPILNVLQKNDLCYVIAIVIRYFGGIKLGSNGLIRAYSNTISSLISDNIKEIEMGYFIKISDNYDKISLIEYILQDSEIIQKEYHDKVIIYALIHKKTLEKLSNVNYQIIDERII